MFRASVDTFIVHSWNSFGTSHHWITSFCAKELVYLVIFFGLLWVALDALKTARAINPFSLFGYVKTALVDAILTLAIPVGIATLISELISKYYVRPRPFAAMADIHQVIPHAADGGFPSHHAVFMAAIAMAIYLRDKPAGKALASLTVLCGFARIAAGIHYPTDIAAGLAIGAVVTLLIDRVRQQLLRK